MERKTFCRNPKKGIFQNSGPKNDVHGTRDCTVVSKLRQSRRSSFRGRDTGLRSEQESEGTRSLYLVEKSFQVTVETKCIFVRRTPTLRQNVKSTYSFLSFVGYSDSLVKFTSTVILSVPHRTSITWVRRTSDRLGSCIMSVSSFGDIMFTEMSQEQEHIVTNHCRYLTSSQLVQSWDSGFKGGTPLFSLFTFLRRGMLLRFIRVLQPFMFSPFCIFFRTI